MKRLIHLLLTGIFISLTAFGENTAQKILTDAASKIENAPSVSASCTLTSNGHKETATLIMSGQKFVVKTDGMSVWFDGTTQWTWSADTREVTITNPTPQELAQINPLSILAGLRSDYMVTLLPSASSVKSLRLAAKRADSDIRQADITLQAGSLTPLEFVVSYSGGTIVKVKITDFKIGKKQPLTIFRYDPGSHPDAEIVDLR